MSPASDPVKDHWNEVAKLWDEMNPPLRPSTRELAVFQSHIDAWTARRTGPAQALVLGATQEFYRLRWPDESAVCALDHTHAMLAALWPGPRGSAIRGDWLAMPLPNASIDLLLCDGGASTVAYPDGLAQMGAEIARILKPKGRALFRLYVRPADPADLQAVWEDLRAGVIQDLSQLKHRLWLATLEDHDHGMNVGRVWEALANFAPDLDALAREIGWRPEHLKAIETYRGASNRYWFPSLEEVRRRWAGALELESQQDPGDPWSHACPVVSFAKGGP